MTRLLTALLLTVAATLALTGPAAADSTGRCTTWNHQTARGSWTGSTVQGTATHAGFPLPSAPIRAEITLEFWHAAPYTFYVYDTDARHWTINVSSNVRTVAVHTTWKVAGAARATCAYWL